MTKTMIDLPEVIAKSDDADFLQELIQDAAQMLMDIEVTEISDGGPSGRVGTFATTGRGGPVGCVSRRGGGGGASGGSRTPQRGRTHGAFPVGTECQGLALVGLGSKAGCACPLPQYHLADALGLSAVHVNRVLRQLREAGLVTFRDGFVAFQDHHGLADFAQFDPTYLDHGQPLLR